MNYTLGYLPHIEGDWNQNTAYDPMAIVTNNGTSYIAKVAVPMGQYEPGVDAGWTAYWHPMAQGIQGVQGAQGIQGIQGVQGAQGVQGTQGTQGYKGDKGSNGDIGTGIWYTDLTLERGDNAVPMVKMSGGNTIKPKVNDYLMDARGNLFTIVDISGDTCNARYVMPLRDGTQGAQGAQGIQGVTGAQGAQGVQGVQGIAGTQGAQGVQGLQGVQGVTGAQGTAPANTETFTFEMLNGTTVTKTFYIIP